MPMIALHHTAWVEDSPLEQSEAELTRDQTAAYTGKDTKMLPLADAAHHHHLGALYCI